MNDATLWYAALERPFFAPPAWIFGPVWTVLYIIIAISFGYVFYQALRGRMPKRVAVPFLLNLALNASFTPVAFGLQNLPAASAIVLLTLITIIWMMIRVWPHSRAVAYAQIPYLLWVSFATILQLSVTYLNLGVY
jgi:tryptophan-rich sensory protein